MRIASRWIAFAASPLALGLASGIALAADPAPSAPPPPATSCVRGVDLMTDAERQEQHAKLAAATTPEARQAVMEAHHAAMQARAKERGAVLCANAKGPGKMGPGMGQGRGMGMGPKSGPPPSTPPDTAPKTGN